MEPIIAIGPSPRSGLRKILLHPVSPCLRKRTRAVETRGPNKKERRSFDRRSLIISAKGWLSGIQLNDELLIHDRRNLIPRGDACDSTSEGFLVQSQPVR